MRRGQLHFVCGRQQRRVFSGAFALAISKSGSSSTSIAHKRTKAACWGTQSIRRRNDRSVIANSAIVSSPVFESRRCFLVQSTKTPNERCMRFFVKGCLFLDEPTDATLSFDADNAHLSPLAQRVLDVPGVAEVTIGYDFFTVHRFDQELVDEYLAMEHELVEMAKKEVAERKEKKTKKGEPMGGELEGHEGAPNLNVEEEEEQEQEQEETTAAFHERETGIITGEADAWVPQVKSWYELQYLIAGAMSDYQASGDSAVDLDAPHPHADTIAAEGDSEVVLCIKELVATEIRPQLHSDGGDIRFVSFDEASGEVAIELLGACKRCKSSDTTLRNLIERTMKHWVPEVKEIREVKSSRGGASPEAIKSRKEAAASMMASLERIDV